MADAPKVGLVVTRYPISVDGDGVAWGEQALSGIPGILRVHHQPHTRRLCILFAPELVGSDRILSALRSTAPAGPPLASVSDICRQLRKR